MLGEVGGNNSSPGKGKSSLGCQEAPGSTVSWGRAQSQSSEVFWRCLLSGLFFGFSLSAAVPVLCPYLVLSFPRQTGRDPRVGGLSLENLASSFLRSSPGGEGPLS